MSIVKHVYMDVFSTDVLSPIFEDSSLSENMLKNISQNFTGSVVETYRHICIFEEIMMRGMYL